MKKLFAGVMMLVSVSAMGQGAKVLNAYNYLQDQELVKAKAEIEPATTHAKTSLDGKTWYYRGMIYEQIYFSKEEALKDEREGSLMTAIESYAKSRELGSKKINMNDLNSRYERLGAYAYQEGVNRFNAKDYAGAASYFETCYNVKKEFGSTDSGAIFNAAIAEMRTKNYEKAIEDFNTSIELKYSLEDSYVNLASTYQEMGNDAKYKETLAAARLALPQSQKIITAEIDIYLAAKEYDKALTNLDLAVKNDPENEHLFFARGNILDHQQSGLIEEGKREEAGPIFDRAMEDYKSALEINPDFFDAAYSLGAMYYNKGADMLNEANMVSDDNAYKEAKDAASEVLGAALPYLEKAHSLKPEDVSTMTSLKELYARTNQMDKYNEMNEKLSN